jgi:PPOX class probable F420-dependent enzyme
LAEVWHAARLADDQRAEQTGDAVPLNMSRQEREEFLTGLHVGVLSVASQDGAGPLAVPVWYTYSPGGTVNVSTGRATRKAAAVRAAGRFALCAQDERPPYKYVTVEGPVAIEEATQDERRELAYRYLGPEGGEAYLAAVPGGHQIMLRMTPEHWLTADYSKG